MKLGLADIRLINLWFAGGSINKRDFTDLLDKFSIAAMAKRLNCLLACKSIGYCQLYLNEFVIIEGAIKFRKHGFAETVSCNGYNRV